MISTTVLIAVQMRYVKHLPWIVPIVFFTIWGFVDGACHSPPSPSFSGADDAAALFWGASFKKVPEGAWVPLMFGVVL